MCRGGHFDRLGHLLDRFRASRSKKNLADREAQLDHWSQLNQQLQQQTMDNRNMSQAELKQFIASNQEAAAAFAEIQRRLQQREMPFERNPDLLRLHSHIRRRARLLRDNTVVQGDESAGLGDY